MVDDGEGGSIQVKNKVSAWGVAAKLYPALDVPVKPFVKLGFARLSNKESYSLPAFAAVTKSSSNLMYGAGVDYPIAPRMRLGLEYEAYGKAGTTDDNSDDSARVKPKLLGLSLSYSF